MCKLVLMACPATLSSAQSRFSQASQLVGVGVICQLGDATRPDTSQDMEV